MKHYYCNYIYIIFSPSSSSSISNGHQMSETADVPRHEITMGYNGPTGANNNNYYNSRKRKTNNNNNNNSISSSNSSSNNNVNYNNTTDRY